MELFKCWNSSYITGDLEVPKPPLVVFNNSEKAIKLLNKHIKNNSRIVVHADVDMDGIGCAYILDRFLISQGARNNLYIINKEKIHGIQEKHVDFFNNKYETDLVVILDSSSNEVNHIKNLNCDVICIDHHEILHNETTGSRQGQNKNGGTKNLEYVIVNNMISNSDISWINESHNAQNNKAFENVGEYQADPKMSCGLVLYELLRLYSEYYGVGNVLENLLLYQWVGITLFTDAINLLSDRNQWYIDNTVNKINIEPTLKVILGSLDNYRARVDKSFINYTMAPVFNRAIRASASGEALDIVLNRPQDVCNLHVYRQRQDDAVEIATKNVVFSGGFIARDITNLDIDSNYTGVIAGNLSGRHNKNTVVYKVKDGIAKGSFRGRYGELDYRKKMDEYSQEVYAQGHGAAFGFRIPVEKLEDAMESLNEIEQGIQQIDYLTVGENIPIGARGVHHVDDIGELRSAGNLYRLAIGNSRVSSKDSVNIIVSIKDVTMDRSMGKLYIYNVLGMECKAFELIETPVVEVYLEQSTSIDFYVRNKRH